MARTPDNQVLLEAITDLSQRTSGEIRELSDRISSHNARQEHIIETVNTLEREILRGQNGRPSMRSQVDLIEHRVGRVEFRVEKIEKDTANADASQRTHAVQLQQTKMSVRAKLIVAAITLVGLVVTSLGTYFATKASASEKPPTAPLKTR